MKVQAKRNEGVVTKATKPIHGVVVGKVVRLKEDGHVFVDYPGNEMGPLISRMTVSAKASLNNGNDPAGREVILMFQNGDPRCPIVVDALYSLLDEIAERGRSVPVEKEAVCPLSSTDPNRIVLQCGESSITLTKAGKIIIRGAYVLSRSSGANKIKGASVEIN